MGFLNPGLLGLLALGGIPVIIHLLNRRRHQVVRWPAMAFLLAAQVKTRQRLRMENLLLLLARTMAVLLFAFAATRPYVRSGAETLQALGPDRRHLYILVDNSASMGYREGLSTLLERAVREAHRAVDEGLRPDDPVTLVVGCDEFRRRNGRPVALLHGTRDRAKVKEVLDRVAATPSHGRMDPAAALAELAAVADAGDPRRSLLVLSDFARSDWLPAAAAPGPDGAPAAPAADAIQAQLDRLEAMRFELAGAFRFLGDPDPENVGVLSLGPADGRAPAEGRAASFEVVVGNFGSAPCSPEVTLSVDGREVGRRRVDLRGRARGSAGPETARVAFPWSGAAGPHHAEARVAVAGNRWVGDPGAHRAGNDARGHAFEVRERLRVLLVDGDPAPPEGRLPETRLLEISLGLSRAVAPADCRVIPASDLGRETFAATDVVVLANVDRIPDAALDRLAAFVRGGGGLFHFLGDRTDPLLWNGSFRRPSAEGILPARLAARPRLERDGPVSLDLAASDHPALHDLTDPRAGTAFEPPLVSGWWAPERPLPAGTDALLHLRDLERTPFLLARRVGRGAVLLCTTSADFDWCGHGLYFAPFVQECVAWLATAGAERRDLVVHETLLAEIPEGARGLTVTDPRGQRSGDLETSFRGDDAAPGAAPGAPAAPGASVAAARVVAFPETRYAGRYVLRGRAPDARDGRGAWLEEPGLAFAVNLDPREIDPARMAPAALEERYRKRGLGASAEAAERERSREREEARGDLTGVVLALGVLFVVLEMFLAALFGSRRR